MFTPIQSLLGGYLLHLSTSSLLTDNGRVLGISSVLDGALWGGSSITHSTEDSDKAKKKEERSWRWAILLGLLGGPVMLPLLGIESWIPFPGSDIIAGQDGSLKRNVLAGLLVGLGTKLGSGCTSGHFLCGLSRLSPRSILATATFFPLAVVTSRYLPLPASGLARIDGGSMQGGLGKEVLGSGEGLSGISIPTKREIKGMIWLVLVAVGGRYILRTILLAFPPSPKSTQATRRIRDRGERIPSWISSPFHSILVRKNAPYFLAGLTFSLGLLLSGMSDPRKVLGFFAFPNPISSFRSSSGSPGWLDVWDPSLGMVFLGGVVPNGIHWRRLLSRTAMVEAPREQKDHTSLQPTPNPIYRWETWTLPPPKTFASPPSQWNITPHLLLGSALFGIGWGLSGICPGPMVVALGQGFVDLFRAIVGNTKDGDGAGLSEVIMGRTGLFGFAVAVAAGQRLGRSLV